MGSLKGRIPGGHIALNNFELLIGAPVPYPGKPCITKISGIKEILEHVELPDRTKAPTGQTKPGNFKISFPLHDVPTRLYFEEWINACKAPVSPLSKRSGTVVMYSIYAGSLFGAITGSATYGLSGLFIEEADRMPKEFDMKNEGEMAEIELTLSFDNVYPV
jgi:hypothetical protein